MAEQVGPLRRGPVARDQDVARFAPFGHHIIEVGGDGIDQRLEPEVAQDEQCRAQIPAQVFRPRASRPTAMEMRRHLVGVDAEDVNTLSTRFMGQRLRQRALAHPGRAADQHVAFLANVVTARQVEYL